MGVKRPEGERYRKPKRLRVHCWVWVDDAALPGLVLEWRKTKELRWEARVTYTDARDLAGGSMLVERWVQASAVMEAPTPDPDSTGRPF